MFHTVYVTLPTRLVSARRQLPVVSLMPWPPCNCHMQRPPTCAAATADHLLIRQIWQVLWLAFPAVVASAALTAAFVKYALPYGWSWHLSLLVGSILSLTDPVATVALLKELGVSETISTLIEATSLFNDGSALVLFLMFVGAIQGDSLTAGKVPVLFIRWVACGRRAVPCCAL
jgi:NhaP-type Na+/H+ or K+/H+ antiporter